METERRIYQSIVLERTYTVEERDKLTRHAKISPQTVYDYEFFKRGCEMSADDYEAYRVVKRIFGKVNIKRRFDYKYKR